MERRKVGIACFDTLRFHAPYVRNRRALWELRSAVDKKMCKLAGVVACGGLFAMFNPALV
jgi:hypothetical protein